MKPATNGIGCGAQAIFVVCITLPILLCGCIPDDLKGKLTGSDSSSESSETNKAIQVTATTNAPPETYIWEANPAPVIEPLGAQSTPAGRTLSFNVVASDPDGSVPVLSCVDCPSGASFDPAIWGGVFSWQPSPDIETREPYRVTFRAVDAITPTLIAEKSVYITVADVAPQLAVIEDQTILEGEILELPLPVNPANVLPSRVSVMIFDAPLTDSLTARGVDFTFGRASEATYRDGTGRMIHVPTNTPRFLDNSRGILIEGRRTNLVAPSINLGSEPWAGNFRGTAIDDFGIAPDGAMTSSLVTGNTNPLAGRKIPITLIPLDHYEVPADRYALKVHIKAGSSRLSRFGVYNDTRAAWESFVEVAWEDGFPSVSNSKNTTMGDTTDRGQIYLDGTGYEGWWTLVFSFQKDPTTTLSDAVFFLVEPDRNGTSNHIEVWGAQLEPGHLSTSYIHNTTTSPKVREPDLLTYDIRNFALGFPSNNVMVESEYYPQWSSDEVRGWHPRFWGSMVDESTYFLARTSRSSPNFVATRTFDADALREDVTLGPRFTKDDLVRVVVRAESDLGLEILPDFKRNGTCGIELVTCVTNRENQKWGDRLMIGNLTGLAASNMSARETDGPLNAPIRHMRVHALDATTPNLHGVSVVNGVFTWTPKVGAATQSPYLITVRATDATDPSVYVQQDVELTVVPLP
ncbi:MAG: hypothetical protein ACC700_17830 [Anaerolineales bacterium]